MLAVVKLAIEALRAAPDFAKRMADAYKSGELDDRFKWYGWEGAKEYVEAVARGDVAGTRDIDLRRVKCLDCEYRVAHPSNPKRLGSCGPMFVDLRETERGTCGCPIEMLTCVASKACPKHFYPACLTVDGKNLANPS